MSLIDRFLALLRAQAAWIVGIIGLFAQRLHIVSSVDDRPWLASLDDVRVSTRDRKLLDELRELLPMDAFTGDERVRTPFGHTQTWRMGPSDGRRVVLVHGLTCPAPALFAQFAGELVNRGFNVLLFDVYGRGYSSTPKIGFSMDLAALQLAAVLDSVGWQSATVIGTSMGGAIAGRFARLYPRRTDAVVMIGPAGWWDSVYRNWTTMPGLSSLLRISFFRKTLASVLFYAPGNVKKGGWEHANDRLAYLQAYLLPGFIDSVAATIRCLHVGRYEDMKEICAQETRTLAIWSPTDQSCPYTDGTKRLLLANSDATLVSPSKGGHDLTCSRPGYVAAEIAKWLQ